MVTRWWWLSYLNVIRFIGFSNILYACLYQEPFGVRKNILHTHLLVSFNLSQVCLVIQYILEMFFINYKLNSTLWLGLYGLYSQYNSAFILFHLLFIVGQVSYNSGPFSIFINYDSSYISATNWTYRLSKQYVRLLFAIFNLCFTSFVM